MVVPPSGGRRTASELPSGGRAPCVVMPPPGGRPRQANYPEYKDCKGPLSPIFLAVSGGRARVAVWGHWFRCFNRSADFATCFGRGLFDGSEQMAPIRGRLFALFPKAEARTACDTQLKPFRSQGLCENHVFFFRWGARFGFGPGSSVAYVGCAEKYPECKDGKRPLSDFLRFRAGAFLALLNSL